MGGVVQWWEVGAVSQWEELGVDTATHWGYTETRLQYTEYWINGSSYTHYWTHTGHHTVLPTLSHILSNKTGIGYPG